MSKSPSALGMRGRIAVRALRVVNATSRGLGRGSGTVAGGRVAMKIDEDLFRKLFVGRTVILVSGTNGKTTTTALVRAAIGGDPASNLTGSNMAAGIVAALSTSTSSTCVIEVDEPWLPTVMNAARDAARRAVVLLNLSRDQLDRASEVRQLAQRWRDHFSSLENSAEWDVIANVNDPLVAYAVQPAAKVTACALPTPWHGDAISCPHCTKPIHFDEGLFGSWWCDCGFRAPHPDVFFDDGVRMDGVTYPLSLQLPGSFNAANAAAAVAAAQRIGVPPVDSIPRVNAVEDVAGRFGERMWKEQKFRLLLAKNPAGLAALISTVSEGSSPVVVSINANVADGRDPSWLYDAPFERLRGRTVWCDGTRALDLMTRLFYAGVDVRLTDDDPLFPRGLPSGEIMDVIGNYTAFAQWVKKSKAC